ncbi:alpha/beta fold hydrolase [Fluviispira vulneris]|uniref:alpha/beta fold hydrolase n=1 Tax=Fluviispira vulneris TaxID=2763012 RepID=UPI00164967F9|nr:alpha/beta fold hydrolase [Fluviispira vulneris]
MRYFKFFIVFIQLVVCLNSYSNNIKITEHFIKYGSESTLYVKEKSFNKAIAKNKRSGIVILLPPLCIPSAEAFDIPAVSFMDELAKAGLDVFSVDFEGMGKSTYPKEMEIYPPPEGVYPLQSKDAIKQLSVIIDYITKLKNVEKVSLIGWSFGSIVAAEYASINHKNVDKLVLTGAMHSFSLPLFTKPFADKNNQFNAKLGAYQNIPWEAIYSHWKMMMQEKDLVTQDTINSIEKVYRNLDSKSRVPGSIRRVMGPMKDLFEVWNERPVYEISKIIQPTLVINGDQDLFADKNLFKKLTGVKFKKEIIIKNATHWIIYENNRKKYIDAIVSFLKNKETESAS